MRAGLEQALRIGCCLPHLSQNGCLIARSTKPGYTSQGSAPISENEFSDHRQGLIQLPLQSIKASTDYSSSWIRAIPMFTRSQIQGLITFILLHIRSLFTPLFTGLQTSRKFWSQSHTDLHLHPWLPWWELQRRVWICITQSSSAQKPAGRSKAIRQHKEIEMEFLGERDH